MTTATFTKLRNGDWGLKGHNLISGASVTVRKASGATTSARVGKVIWTGADGTCIATIERDAHAPRQRSRNAAAKRFQDYADLHGEGAAVARYGGNGYAW